MSKIIYGCTALRGTNKVGKLKKDDNGYYEVCLGAFDFENNAGDIYVLETAKRHFEDSSAFMRRVRNGQLRGECGHPRQHEYPNLRAWITRVLTIDERNVAQHIKSVWLDTCGVKDQYGRKIVPIMGAVRPSGVMDRALTASLENIEENVAFSIRTLTKDNMVNGRWEKHIRELVTFDYVNEPGISKATKYNTASLESICDETIVTESLLLEAERYQQTCGISMESSGIDFEMIRTTLGWQKVQVLGRPRDLEW